MIHISLLPGSLYTISGGTALQVAPQAIPVAEEARITMPSFCGDMRYSCLILLPLFVGITLVVF